MLLLGPSFGALALLLSIAESKPLTYGKRFLNTTVAVPQQAYPTNNSSIALSFSASLAPTPTLAASSSAISSSFSSSSSSTLTSTIDYTSTRTMTRTSYTTVFLSSDLSRASSTSVQVNGGVSDQAYTGTAGFASNTATGASGVPVVTVTVTTEGSCITPAPVTVTVTEPASKVTVFLTTTEYKTQSNASIPSTQTPYYPISSSILKGVSGIHANATSLAFASTARRSWSRTTTVVRYSTIPPA